MKNEKAILNQIVVCRNRVKKDVMSVVAMVEFKSKTAFSAYRFSVRMATFISKRKRLFSDSEERN